MATIQAEPSGLLRILLLGLCTYGCRAAEGEGAVVGCTDLEADNFDALAIEHDESLCRYNGLPRVPLGNEDANLGYHATKAHCEQRGGQLVGSDTLRVLGYETAEAHLPRMWPVYEPLDRVAGMPPLYKVRSTLTSPQVFASANCTD
eukprot:COSAG02_NODE_7624_length_2927_cov_189.260255_2_plen_147_part_00